MTSKQQAPEPSVTLRALMSLAGLAFAVTGGVLAFAVGKLLLVGSDIAEVTLHDRLFWALLGVIAFCLLLLAVNFFHAVVRRRVHNIVPGPTMYLLGVTLVILGMFMGVSNAWMTAVVLGATGFAIMSLEYRSEFI